MLKLEGVTKEFGGVKAVHNFNLELNDGELAGLIGPNGAGKTTVTNLISGLASLTSGAITLDGIEIGQMEPARIARAGIARTFQMSRLFHRLSALDNVIVSLQERAEKRASTLSCMLGRPHAYREQREWRLRAKELIGRLGILDWQDRPAGTLPYGAQRRLEIARALALRPRVLLLDEPIAGMTDAEAAPLGEIFEELAREGMGVLLIEHNVPFVTRLCSHVHVLSYGELIAAGPPATVLENDAVIRAYLGS